MPEERHGRITPLPRKRRPRSHIIADLSVNFVERQVLLAGYSVQRLVPDYGTDLIVFTYNSRQEVEPGSFYLQVKATDHLRTVSDNATISLRVARSDLDYWASSPAPFVLAIYDAIAERAYWLHVQAYVGKMTQAQRSVTTTVHVPRIHEFGPEAVREIRAIKNQTWESQRKGLHHEDEQPHVSRP